MVFFCSIYFSQISIITYHKTQYQKRINLLAKAVKGLFREGKRILEECERVGEACLEGRALIQPYRVILNPGATCPISVIVTSYRGEPKIHFGTVSYTSDLYDLALGLLVGVKPPARSGHVIPVSVVQELINSSLGQRILRKMSEEEDRYISTHMGAAV